MPRDRTAGLVVVGNEILSGKVVDTNAPFLARELRALGVELRRIVTIPDDLEEIAAAVREFAARYDVVFTSGGVGPTHDDVLPGIPELFEQKFLALRDRFAAAPYHLRVVYTREGEGAIAEHLNATLAAFPDLLLGSYPKLADPEYAVKLTLESKDRAYVERALAHLLALLPPEAVVRTE